MRGTFWRRNPGVDGGACKLRPSRLGWTVVRHGDDLSRTHAKRGERPDQAIGPRDRGKEPERLVPERGDGQDLPRGPAHACGRCVDMNDVVGPREQGLARRTKVTGRRKTPAPPRPIRVHGEERERAWARATTNRDRPVEDEDVRARVEPHGLVDGGLPGGPNDDGYAGFGELTSANEGFVADVDEAVIRLDDARGTRSDAVRVPDESDVRAEKRELARHRDRYACLPRATERRATDTDEQNVVRHVRGPHEAARRQPRYCGRENACDEAMKAPRLEGLRGGMGKGHRTNRRHGRTLHVAPALQRP